MSQRYENLQTVLLNSQISICTAKSNPTMINVTSSYYTANREKKQTAHWLRFIHVETSCSSTSDVSRHTGTQRSFREAQRSELLDRTDWIVCKSTVFPTLHPLLLCDHSLQFWNHKKKKGDGTFSKSFFFFLQVDEMNLPISSWSEH